jgi:hypothetical protein
VVLLLITTPVSTAGRSVTCDIDQPDSHGMMYVRSQQCWVDTVGTHTDITVDNQQAHWVLDLPKAELRTLAWSWYDGVWHRIEHDDRVLWSGSVKTDQLNCRFGVLSKVRYVFSNDTAICLTQ